MKNWSGHALLLVIFLSAISSIPTDAKGQSAAEVKDLFWVLWEKREMIGDDCPNSVSCVYRRSFQSRLLAQHRARPLVKLFAENEDLKWSSGGKALSPPRICQDTEPHGATLGNPELQLLSNKLDAMRGLVGVGMNLRNLRPPPGHRSDFGDRLQAVFEEKFRNVGLIVVSPDEAARLPGQPKLNLFLSFTAPDSTCEYTYSVFASLSQTALLSRDLRTKLSVSVWSVSTKPSSDFPNANEFDAVVRVADAFVADYREANAKKSP